jgi:hypothetical protein
MIQTRTRAGPTIAAEAAHAVPRHGRDDSRARGQASNAVVATVGNVQVAAAIHRNSTQASTQHGACAGPFVAAEARSTVACHRCDDPRARRQPSDAVIVPVGDKQVAIGIYSHVLWIA